MSEFKELQREWYSKLKASGFRDIEEVEGQEKLPGMNSVDAMRLDKTQPFRGEYFAFASKYLYALPRSYPLKSRLVWYAYSEGYHQRDIGAAVGLSHAAVRSRLRKMRVEMREWMKEQLSEDDVY